MIRHQNHTYITINIFLYKIFKGKLHKIFNFERLPPTPTPCMSHFAL